MEIEIQLTNAPIAENISAAGSRRRRRVGGISRRRARRGKRPARFPRWNTRLIRKWRNAKSAGCSRKFQPRHPCLAAKVIHRLGVVPVGETAIYVGVAAKHRGEAFALLAEFMDRLKQDVPIWKRRALPVPSLYSAHCGTARVSGQSRNSHTSCARSTRR